MRALSTCLILSLAAALSSQAANPSNYTWTTIRGAGVTDSSVTHDAKKSLRVEPAAGSPDAAVRSAAIQLTLGKTYELTGWVRTQDLTVHDTDRSPIPSGAALTMASMPFDVHSSSLAGTRDWTKLSLRFVATKSQDQILLTAGSGGSFKGKAWFEGVTVDEASAADSWPSQDAVQTFGPAYRYPAAGWIYLHIEGKPYDRGYQHGYLMSHEIPEYLKRCAFDLGAKPDRWAGIHIAMPPTRFFCAASIKKFSKRCRVSPMARMPPARGGSTEKLNSATSSC